MDKEIVQYTAPETGDSVTGLSATNDYYVVKISDDEFSLRLVGAGSTLDTVAPRETDYYWDNVVPVDITKGGGGSFNYQPITISVKGKVGISSIAGDTFECETQPIFRGSIKSVHLTDNGVGYGSSEIINFNRQPQVTLVSGKEAQLQPVVVNGSITEVVVMSKGQKYNAAPTLTLLGDGVGLSLIHI